ncbi:MAG TPA: nitroreductase family deazaflavin-dependent oxidoreductase [Solirubrobacter sp.]|nr:nitroreductase family deazaflavin-dependent oxidoreductase [Solirubrobacter sp.]
MLFGPEHTKQYKQTGGEVGHEWQGTQTLLLTTTGRKSGEPRELPLIYGRRGDDYLVVASKGGADAPPAWYVNLTADPEVEVQVKDERFKAHAREATPDEKPELWSTMTAEWPAYDEYQQKTERQIPVIVLEREDS